MTDAEKMAELANICNELRESGEPDLLELADAIEDNPSEYMDYML